MSLLVHDGAVPVPTHPPWEPPQGHHHVWLRLVLCPPPPEEQPRVVVLPHRATRPRGQGSRRQQVDIYLMLRFIYQNNSKIKFSSFIVRRLRIFLLLRSQG